MSEAVIARLEAVASRLEALAARGGAGGGSAAASADGGDEQKSAKVEAYEAFYAESVAPLAAIAAKYPDLKYISDGLTKAFTYTGQTIQAAHQCKKPKDSDFLKFLDPIVQVMGEAEKKCDNRSKVFPFQKAYHELIQACQWLMQSLPKPIIEGQLEAADFHLIKILNTAKDLPDPEKSDYRAFVSGVKKLIGDLTKYVVANYKTGIEWNGRGGELSAWKPGAAGGAPSAPSAPAAPAAPAAPPAPAAPAADAPAGKPASVGMGAVFGEISKGSAVTAGLKKVDKSQMTHKNPELRSKPGLEAKAPAPKAAAPKAQKSKGEAKIHEARGTWFVENYDDAHDLEVPDPEVKQNVYIVRCDNVTVNIPKKVKSIQVDSCKKTRVIFNSVVSTFECFNSQRCDIECTTTVPSVALDKCSGIVVQMLNDEGKANPPQIVTSNISECNFTVTGKRPEDDPIEIPLPEQYISIYNPATGKIDTQPTNHGD